MSFAILGVAGSFGGALVNQTPALIGLWGWRDTFKIVAGIFSGFSLLSILIIREPSRGVYTFLKEG